MTGGVLRSLARSQLTDFDLKLADFRGKHLLVAERISIEPEEFILISFKYRVQHLSCLNYLYLPILLPQCSLVAREPLMALLAVYIRSTAVAPQADEQNESSLNNTCRVLIAYIWSLTPFSLSSVLVFCQCALNISNTTRLNHMETRTPRRT
jgi:hypothetical protein